MSAVETIVRDWWLFFHAASGSKQTAARLGFAVSTLTLTAKGQVTLRKDLLRHLGFRPGEKLAVEKLSKGRIVVKAARPAGNISDVFDMFKRKGGPSLSIEEINDAAAQGWAGKR